jgi:hypothetical protein
MMWTLRSRWNEDCGELDACQQQHHYGERPWVACLDAAEEAGEEFRRQQRSIAGG